ncbi:type II toxin-antitoxin system HicA family toxin, partial [Acinetobacter baumannii]
MSQSDKLEQKLRAKPKPVSFPWDDLVTLMKQYGFTVLTRKAKGSHFTFYHPETGL